MTSRTGNNLHTPGAWEAWLSPDKIWTVRSIYMMGDLRFTAWPAVCNCGGQDNEANARLIAAAPALLEACRDLLFALEATDTCLKSWNHGQGSPANVDGISERASAAIALASPSHDR